MCSLREAEAAFAAAAKAAAALVLARHRQVDMTADDETRYRLVLPAFLQDVRQKLDALEEFLQSSSN
jgi:hypothetical protein